MFAVYKSYVISKIEINFIQKYICNTFMANEGIIFEKWYFGSCNASEFMRRYEPWQWHNTKKKIAYIIYLRLFRTIFILFKSISICHKYHV